MTNILESNTKKEGKMIQTNETPSPSTIIIKSLVSKPLMI
jgi:hypothetical protein